ncbi:hypothetical protein ABTF61_19460, partial [Acinetobacter baumannii]
NHMTEPGVQRQFAQGDAARGQATYIVDGIVFFEELDRLVPGGCRRIIEKSQLPGIGDTPGCEVEYEIGEIRFEDFRS